MVELLGSTEEHERARVEPTSKWRPYL